MADETKKQSIFLGVVPYIISEFDNKRVNIRPR